MVGQMDQDEQMQLALAASLSMQTAAEEEARRRKERQEEEERRRYGEFRRLQLLQDESLALAIAKVENEDVYQTDEAIAREEAGGEWQPAAAVTAPPSLDRSDSAFAARVAREENADLVEQDAAIARAVHEGRTDIPVMPVPPARQQAAVFPVAAQFAEPHPQPPQPPAATSDYLDIDSMTHEELERLTEQVGNVSRGLSPAAIASLPEERFCGVRGGEDAECCVCREVFQLGELLRRLPCLHRFHKHCVDEWLARENLCPIDRKQAVTR